MKKLITSLAAGILLVSSSFAEIQKEYLSFGVRGSAGASILDIDENAEKDLGNSVAEILSDITGNTLATYSVENNTTACGGFAFWGNYSFPSIPALGIQGELGFLFNNGTEITAESKTTGASIKVTDKLSYTTLELPILMTYTVNKGGFFEFIPHGGFYLSFPIGKCKQEIDTEVKALGYSGKDSETTKDKIDSSVIVGMAIGTDFAFNFSKTSALMLNMRYMYDFNELKVDGDEIARRSAFLFSAGYRYTLH